MFFNFEVRKFLLKIGTLNNLFMKKIYYLLLFVSLFNNLTFAQIRKSTNHPKKSQETQLLYKRVQINKSIPNVMHKLEEAGVDLGCGVYYTEKNIQIELSDYELNRISDQGVSYTVLINDVTKFYADRAKKDMPLAQSNLLAEKRRAATAKSSSVKSNYTQLIR